jgi:hypothetical protein
MTHQSPTFYVLHPLLQALLENVGAVTLPGAAGPEVENVVAGAAEPLVESVAVGTAVSEVVEPVVVAAAAVFVALASAPGVAEPQAYVHTRIAFHVLLPASVTPVEVYNPGHPRSLAFPSVDYHASFSSSVEVVDKESVHSATGVRTNDGLYSILSTLGLRQNRNLELYHSKPNLDHNNVTDTNDLPTDATTSHSRKRRPHRYQGQHRHMCQESRSPQVAREKESVAAEEIQYGYLLLPWSGVERH